MTHDDGTKTLADIGAVAATLRELTDDVNAMLNAHHGDAELFVRPSMAASDVALNGYRELINDVLAFANLQVAAALDHADMLAKWGSAAAAGEPTPVWAPWSVARSLVELCAAARWLAETPLPTRTRVGRMLSISKRDALSMIRIGQDESAKLADAEDCAARLGLRSVENKRGTFLGFGEATPTFSAQVKALLSDIRKLEVYSLLSAASHGEPWAIYALGYEAVEPEPAVAGGRLAIKKPPAFWIWSALTLSVLALTSGARAVSIYRGWVRG